LQGNERLATSICSSKKLILATVNKENFSRVFSVSQKKEKEKRGFFTKNFDFLENMGAL
jgi:hypothetical protein